MLKCLLKRQFGFYLALGVCYGRMRDENEDHADIDKLFDVLRLVSGSVCRLRQVGL